MRRGKLRHRVALEQQVTTQDETGDPVPTWVRRAIQWADIQPIRAREMLQSNQVLSSLDTLIVLGWSRIAAQMNPTWRIIDLEMQTIYNVTGIVDPDMRHQSIEVSCTSGTNDG